MQDLNHQQYVGSLGPHGPLHPNPSSLLVPLKEPLRAHEPLLAGSCVVISRVTSRVTIVMTYITGLI